MSVLWLLAAGLLGGFVAISVLIGRGTRRFQRAIDECDVPAAQRILDSFPADDAVAINRAVLLTVEDRWDEACEALLAIDRAPLSELRRVLLDNNIAWSLAHADRADEAVSLARSAVSHATDPMLLAACLGTLGAALHISGHPTEGLASLREAIALGGRVGLQATRHFYVGECLRALGRTDEAVRAYTEATRLAPKSQFGRRARAALEAMSTGPYR